MRVLLCLLVIVMLFPYQGDAQNNKFRFNIDGTDFLSIRQNPDGFNYIHQNNLQTSMFFGFNSGLNTIDDPMVFSSGDNNTAYGFNTLAANTTGFRNTAIGSSALDENTTGNINTAIGFGAMGEAISASNNVAVGKSALLNNLNGHYNVVLGNDALNLTTSAERSTVIGFAAGVNDTSSVDNVYIGYMAGRGTLMATDGYDRFNNTIIGASAGLFSSTSGNVFLGNEAGRDAKADNQLYITNSATDSLESLIYGQFDNALLRINGDLNIDGLYTLPNTAPTSGQFLRYTGGSNLVWDSVDEVWQFGSGGDALYEDGDVGIGVGNAIYRLDVEDNVSNGYVARFHNSNTGTTSKGLIIQTGPNVNPNSSVYYALFLDGNGTNIGGVRGNGSGGTLYSTTSDRRLKQNIKTFESGLATLEKVRPTIYQTKSNPDQDEIGFIAQELQKVIPHIVAGNPNGDPDQDPMTVDYGRITPVLVAAIQEQQEIISTLTQRLNDQEQQFELLKAQVAHIGKVGEE